MACLTDVTIDTRSVPPMARGGAGGSTPAPLDRDRVEAVALPLLGDIRMLGAESDATLEELFSRASHVRDRHAHAFTLLRSSIEDPSALCMAIGIPVSSLDRLIDEISSTIQDFPAILHRKRVVGIEKLTRDYIDHGHPFHGVPVILDVDMDRDGNLALRLVWRNETADSIPLRGTSFLISDEHVLSKLDAVRTRQPSSIRQLRDLFSYIKNITPHGYSIDGCNPRCLWVACLLQEIFQLDCDKIKVWSKDSKVKLRADPSLFPDKVKWIMHTAPVVKIGGEEYVFDLCLEEPVPLRIWLTRLCNLDQVLISREKKWTMPCLSEAGQKAPMDDFVSLKDDLRAYYLFETMDGNDGSEKKAWPEWSCMEKGVAAIGPVIDLSEGLCDVVMAVERALDGSINKKTRQFPFDKDRFSSFIFVSGEYYTPSAYRKMQVL